MEYRYPRSPSFTHSTTKCEALKPGLRHLRLRDLTFYDWSFHQPCVDASGYIIRSGVSIQALSSAELVSPELCSIEVTDPQDEGFFARLNHIQTPSDAYDGRECSRTVFTCPESYRTISHTPDAAHDVYDYQCPHLSGGDAATARSTPTYKSERSSIASLIRVTSTGIRRTRPSRVPTGQQQVKRTHPHISPLSIGPESC